MPKKVAVGVVVSDKMQKTRRVEIARLVQHPVYGKYIRKRTVCYVHDEQESSALGDTVEIIEDQPRSKKKRWDLVRVVKKNSDADVAALRASHDITAADDQMAEQMSQVERPDSESPVEATQEAAEEVGSEETDSAGEQESGQESADEVAAESAEEAGEEESAPEAQALAEGAEEAVEEEETAEAADQGESDEEASDEESQS